MKVSPLEVTRVSTPTMSDDHGVELDILSTVLMSVINTVPLINFESFAKPSSSGQ